MVGMETQIMSNVERLLGSVGVGLWTWDGNSRWLKLDAMCRSFLDLDENEEWNDELMAERLAADDIDRYHQAIKQCLDTGNFSTEFRVRMRDGSTRFISGRGHAQPHLPDEPPVIRGVFIDVTANHELQNELRLHRSRMQQLIDGVPGLFSYLDRDLNICFMSSRYRDVFETTNDNLVGRHIREVLGDEAFAERRERYERALAGETVCHESQREMPDGTQIFFTITHQPHRDASGEIVGIISLAMDITERREMQRTLERRGMELERSNQDLEQFAYVASHDLKAPLRAVEVLVEWLRDDLEDYAEGEVQENLGLLKQRTRRLNRLLDDLLAYSRAGRKVGEIQAIDSNELVRDITTLLAPPEGVRIDADASLPTLRANRAPLEQVLRNLINNAIKHHPDPENARIRVYARDQVDAVMFAVEDNGTGIPEQYAEKVFQMFQTLQPRDDREGSGMGLAIVKRIVDWQAGRIWFHPGPDNTGTVFKFTWNKQPLGPDSIEEEHHGHEPESRETSQHLAG